MLVSQDAPTIAKLAADLHDNMSQYRVTEISKTPNIAVRTATEVIDGGGRAGFRA
jgi:hypothetical protein